MLLLLLSLLLLCQCGSGGGEEEIVRWIGFTKGRDALSREDEEEIEKLLGEAGGLGNYAGKNSVRVSERVRVREKK